MKTEKENLNENKKCKTVILSPLSNLILSVNLVEQRDSNRVKWTQSSLGLIQFYLFNLSLFYGSCWNSSFTVDSS